LLLLQASLVPTAAGQAHQLEQHDCLYVAQASQNNPYGQVSNHSCCEVEQDLHVVQYNAAGSLEGLLVT
jgi:hypothetical protein